jgi:hypothetical protein
MAYI